MERIEVDVGKVVVQVGQIKGGKSKHCHGGEESGTGSLIGEESGTGWTGSLIGAGKRDRFTFWISEPVPLSYPDGDAITYSLTTQPLGMAIDAAGVVSWPSNQMFLGNHTVTVRATDSRGAAAEQSFTLTVHAPVPNRSPVFDSVPVVTAYVGKEYTYDADASDPDGDTLTYSFVLKPFPEMEIDPASGSISGWTPQGDQVGDHEVKISVTDGDPATEQRFVLRVLAEAGNQSPAIVSTAIDAVLAGAGYRYQVVAVDPDRDDRVTYALAMEPIPNQMTIDQDSGLITWPAPAQAEETQVVVRAADGRGGFDLQEFTLAVIAATPGSITGTVFEDASGNGQRDNGETGLQDWVVYADQNGNRHRDPDEPSVASGADGQYVLANLLPGTHTLLLEHRSGWLQVQKRGRS